MTNSINKHERLKIPYTHNTNYYIIINCIRQTKSESKIYIKKFEELKLAWLQTFKHTLNHKHINNEHFKT